MTNSVVVFDGRVATVIYEYCGRSVHECKACSACLTFTRPGVSKLFCPRAT